MSASLMNRPFVFGLVKMLWMLLRVYLACAAVFELESIRKTIVEGGTRSSAVLRELVGGGRNAAERKGIDALWVAFLWNLSVSRAFLAYDTENTTLFALVTWIHIAEAVLMVRAIPLALWKQEYWPVPFSILQAVILCCAFLALIF